MRSLWRRWRRRRSKLRSFWRCTINSQPVHCIQIFTEFAKSKSCNLTRPFLLVFLVNLILKLVHLFKVFGLLRSDEPNFFKQHQKKFNLWKEEVLFLYLIVWVDSIHSSIWKYCLGLLFVSSFVSFLPSFIHPIFWKTLFLDWIALISWGFYVCFSDDSLTCCWFVSR